MDRFIFVENYASDFIKKKKGDPSDQKYLASLISEITEKKMLLSALMLVSPETLTNKKDILINLLSHKIPNIRIKSLSKLAGMLQTDGTLIYVNDALLNSKFREKNNAVLQICRYGDERAVPAMIKRLRNILNTRKGSPYLLNNKESELTSVICFLHKYLDNNDQIKKVFKRVVEKWDIMVKEEQEFVMSQCAYISELLTSA